jgi:hypothetical protein
MGAVETGPTQCLGPIRALQHLSVVQETCRTVVHNAQVQYTAAWVPLGASCCAKDAQSVRCSSLHVVVVVHA